MAANAYITVDADKPIGARIVGLKEQMWILRAQFDAVYNELSQINVDGALMQYLGTSSVENAAAVTNLVGSVRAALNDADSFIDQFVSRVGRK